MRSGREKLDIWGGGGNQTREDDVKEQVANDVLIHGGFNTYCVSNVLNCFNSKLYQFHSFSNGNN